MLVDVFSSPLDSPTPRTRDEYFHIDFDAAATQHVCEQLGCDVTTLPDRIRSEISSQITENGPTIEPRHIRVIPTNNDDIEKYGIGLKVSFDETAWSYIDNAEIEGFKMTDRLQEMITDLIPEQPNHNNVYAAVEHVVYGAIEHAW